MAIAAVLVLLAIIRPSVADPTVAGLLFAGLVVAVVGGVLWPLGDRRVESMVIVTAPTDVRVGEPTRMTVRCSQGGFPSQVSLDTTLGRIGSEAAGGAVVQGTAEFDSMIDRRGVFDSLDAEVVSRGPFGLVKVTRQVSLALPQRMYVAPGGQPRPMPVAVGGRGMQSDPRPGHGSTGDTVRSVRPYVTGDPAHLVHWPSSARLGELVVLELEPPPTQNIAVVLDLRGAVDGMPGRSDHRTGGAGASECTEATVAAAAGAILWAIGRDVPVLLCTAEESGPRSENVTNELQLHRRLACAVAGQMPEVPEEWSVVRFSPGEKAP